MPQHTHNCRVKLQYTDADSLSMSSFSFWQTFLTISSCDFGILRPATRTQRKFSRHRPETLVQTADLVYAQLVCCTVSDATRSQVSLGVFPLVWITVIIVIHQHVRLQKVYSRTNTPIVTTMFATGTSIRNAASLTGFVYAIFIFISY